MTHLDEPRHNDRPRAHNNIRPPEPHRARIGVPRSYGMRVPDDRLAGGRGLLNGDQVPVLREDRTARTSGDDD